MISVYILFMTKTSYRLCKIWQFQAYGYYFTTWPWSWPDHRTGAAEKWVPRTTVTSGDTFGASHSLRECHSYHLLFCVIRSSSIDGSHVRSNISLFVTLSIQVFLMIERRYRIMKAWSFFTCRLYIVQASATYRRVDSTTARYILPLTSMDTWWLFQSLWRSRPKDALHTHLAIITWILEISNHQHNIIWTNKALHPLAAGLWMPVTICYRK